MNVLQINTFTSGGAAKAAIRQHQALLEYGINSKILFLYGNNDDIPESRVLNLRYSLIKKIKRRIGLYKTQFDRINKLKGKMDGKFEFISLPHSDFRIHNCKDVLEADIIHLHWVANFIDYKSFYFNVKKPIFWTLHDMNPFLGIFHYSEDEKNLSSNVFLINEKVKKEKNNIYKKALSLQFISPSCWMMNEARKSFLASYKIWHIPNSVNTNLYKIHEVKKIREQFGVPLEKKIFLFVSEKIANRRKGFDLLIDSLNHINDKNIYLCCIGEIDESKMNLRHPVKIFGKIEDELILSKIYSMVDAYLLPSRQDNLPNVMLEAFSSGLPVIAFKTGGMAEEIIDGLNGTLSTNISSDGFAEAINRFLLNGVQWSREKIRDYAIKKYSPQVQALELEKLYNSVTV